MENAERNNVKLESDSPHGYINYKRDPDFYFRDGSIIVLVGDVLFKIHTSHFAPYSSKEFFNLSPAEDSANSTVPSATNGSKDWDPVVLPEVEPDQFRNFLYLFYGCPIDDKFKRILNGERVGTLSDTARYYMDVAIASYHMGMDNTQAWALRQLRPMISSSKIVKHTFWPLSRLLQAVRYSKIFDDSVLINGFRSALGFHGLNRFSPRREALNLDPDEIISDRSSPSDLLNSLYRNPVLSGDRASLGQIICVILQAGSQSQMWMELTRNERATFFALQVYLTPLPKRLDCSWLESSVQINQVGERVITCSDLCQTRFDSAWSLVFDEATCMSFKATRPLGGIDALCNLLIKRWEFLVSISSPDDPTFVEHAVCNQCKANLMGVLDRNMDKIFSHLANLFDQVERDGYLSQASLNS